MAGKREKMTDKLTSDKPAGWDEQITGPAPSKSTSELVRKTYLLTPELIARVEALADTENVGLNELVRWLLDDALRRVETGETALPTKPVERRTLDA